MVLRDGWKCTSLSLVFMFPIFDIVRMVLDAILGACDVEGNFLVIKVCGLDGNVLPPWADRRIEAYQYTDLLSCMLLDA